MMRYDAKGTRFVDDDGRPLVHVAAYVEWRDKTPVAAIDLNAWGNRIATLEAEKIDLAERLGDMSDIAVRHEKAAGRATARVAELEEWRERVMKAYRGLAEPLRDMAGTIWSEFGGDENDPVLVTTNTLADAIEAPVFPDRVQE